MLKWTMIVVIAVAGAVALVALIGVFLPKGHRVSRTMTLNAPPAAVFAAITDAARYPEWRRDVTSVELLPDAGGRRQFRENSRNGRITYRFEEVVPDRRVVTRIADPALPYGGTWTYDLKPSGPGTELTITEDGEVYNPIFRTLSKFMSPTATIDAYLANLETRLGR